MSDYAEYLERWLEEIEDYDDEATVVAEPAGTVIAAEWTGSSGLDIL